MFIKCPECCGEIAEGSVQCLLCGHILTPPGGAGPEVNAGAPFQNSAAVENASPPPKRSAFQKSGQSDAPDGRVNSLYAGGSCGEPGKLDPSIRRRSLTGNAIGFMLFFMLGAPAYNLLRPYVRYEYEGYLSIFLMMTPFIGAYLFNDVFLSRAEVEACRRREEEKSDLQKISGGIIIFFIAAIVCIFIIAGILILLFGAFGHWKP
jgi:hypothetical protein